MTDDEVIAKVFEHGGAGAVAGFPMRIAPDGGHPGDKVFRLPVALPQLDGEMYLAVSFSFGQPSDDAMEDWRPRWQSVDGPMTREELEELGRG